MPDKAIDAEVAGPEDPQLIARLRHKCQRGFIVMVLLVILPLVIAWIANKPDAS